MASVDSFVFYRSFYEAIKDLPNEDRLAMYDSISEYALDHTESENKTVVSKGMMALIKPQLDANFRKRQNGAQGGRPKTAQSGEESEDKVDNQGENQNLDETKVKPKDNLDITKGKPNVNANVNANANVNVNSKKENTKERTGFVKPTLEEVRSYCLERNKGVEPEKWFNYYSANGWKVGKNPMKDWKAAVRTWEKNDTSTETPRRQSYEEQANAWRNF